MAHRDMRVVLVDPFPRRLRDRAPQLAVVDLRRQKCLFGWELLCTCITCTIESVLLRFVKLCPDYSYNTLSCASRHNRGMP